MSSSSWLEDCINSLWDMGLRSAKLFLIYLMSEKAGVTVKTPVGGTGPILPVNLVKQETVLNNFSLQPISTRVIIARFFLHSSETV